AFNRRQFDAKRNVGKVAGVGDRNAQRARSATRAAGSETQRGCSCSSLGREPCWGCVVLLRYRSVRWENPHRVGTLATGVEECLHSERQKAILAREHSAVEPTVLVERSDQGRLFWDPACCNPDERCC